MMGRLSLAIDDKTRRIHHHRLTNKVSIVLSWLRPANSKREQEYSPKSIQSLRVRTIKGREAGPAILMAMETARRDVDERRTSANGRSMTFGAT